MIFLPSGLRLGGKKGTEPGARTIAFPVKVVLNDEIIEAQMPG